MTHSEALEKCRKLLALAQSSNEHEAAAAAARAQAIMERYRIDAATLEGDTAETAEPEELRAWEEPLAPAGARWRGVLAFHLCHANGCEVYRHGADYRIIGRASNVATVRYLFEYCRKAVDRLARAKSGNGRTWLNQYRLGCVDAIAQALARERESVRAAARETARAQGGSALVKVENALSRLDAETREAQRFGAVKLGLRGGGSYRVNSNAQARAAGRSDGANIYPGQGARGLASGARRLRG